MISLTLCLMVNYKYIFRASRFDAFFGLSCSLAFCLYYFHFLFLPSWAGIVWLGFSDDRVSHTQPLKKDYSDIKTIVTIEQCLIKFVCFALYRTVTSLFESSQYKALLWWQFACITFITLFFDP